MHVVSVRLHYFLVSPNLTNRKISALCADNNLHTKRFCGFHMVKRLQKSVQYIQTYSAKYAIFGVSYQTFTNELCQVHEIFTRYRGIMYTVNAYIEAAISHSVSECQSDKCGEFAIFHKIGCHGNVP